MSERFREEVLNVTLAQLLGDRGIISVPEVIRKSRSGRRYPDITIAEFWGVQIIIEGRIDEGPGVRESLEEDAKKRVEEGLSPICIAVLYPPELRYASFELLHEEMAKAQLGIKVLTEAGPGSWVEDTVDRLAELLPHTYEVLIREDVVASTVQHLDGSIDEAASGILESKASPARIAKILGIPLREEEKEQERRLARIASLTLVNAMIFQEVLAAHRPKVPTLRETLNSPGPIDGFVEAWNYILEEIDYIPVFQVAWDVLVGLPAGPRLQRSAKTLGEAALRIASNRVALRHDLMGRIYHKLLVGAKYYGAYYTSIPASTLLVKLALDRESWSVDWSDIEEVRGLRVVDPACGTGTLLKSALQAMSHNHLVSRVERKKKPDIPGLHKALVEDVLWGFDVLPFATHLAASALSLHEPDVPFRGMRLFSLPLRGPVGKVAPARLGSLDFISDERIGLQADLFGGTALSEAQVVTEEGGKEVSVKLPDMDLCVMNPPFTRSVGGNLLFGSLPKNERQKMQTKLKKDVKKKELKANITAGLGSVFVALADKKVKKGGSLALVLPKALLSGEAWQSTRELLSSEYTIRYVIMSHEPDNWNFSENTHLSETLLVAEKRTAQPTQDAIFVNLWAKPRTGLEALTLANLLREADPPHLKGHTGVCSLETGGRKFGEAIAVEPTSLGGGSWLIEASFAQTDLCRVIRYLLDGVLYIPGVGEAGTVDLTPLGELGRLGPDVRDIHDGFTFTKSKTAYKAFWGHSANKVRTIEQKPNRYLNPLSKAKKGRPFRDANLLWSRSGELLVAERLRLNTKRLTAINLEEPVLASSWWPVTLNEYQGLSRPEVAKILSLWLNSTLGLLTIIATRVETEGAWVKLKKPALEKLPVLDPRELSEDQTASLLKNYERVKNEELKPFAGLREDEGRKAIDDAIRRALGWPRLDTIRELFGSEPNITLEPLVEISYEEKGPPISLQM